MNISGTSGNDTLVGTAGPDVANLFSGNDSFSAYGGDDLVYGGNNDDVIGDDGGDDRVFGGGGDDVLGNIFASTGHDSFYGGDGNDTISGGTGNDLLVGGNDDDVLGGGSGSDAYVVTDGFDTIYESEVYGGTDRILFAATLSTAVWELYRIGEDLFIDVTGGPVAAVGNHFRLYDAAWQVETLEFVDGVEVDLLSLSYTTYGTSGNDGINGVAVGGRPDDTIYAFGGNDTIYADFGDDVVYCGKGDDSVSDFNFNGGGNDVYFGDAGSDRLYGLNGNDLLDGGAGKDTLVGGNGQDTFVVSAGRDVLIGGGYQGDVDTILFTDDTTASTFTAFRRGSDLHIGTLSGKSLIVQGHFHIYNNYEVIEFLQFSDGTRFDLRAASYVTYGTSGDDDISGVEVGRGGQADDTILAGGGDDRVSGGLTGRDTLYGGNGQDTLYGGSEDDELSGDGGLDTLYGGFGNDVLAGGRGSNTLDGDYGNDTYLVGEGFDRIRDARGNDELQFIDATTLADLGFARFGADLGITTNGVGVVTIKDQYYGNFPGDYTIETIVFSDGSRFDLTGLLL